MKKILIVSAALILILWALLFFVIKVGEIAHILLAFAGITILFTYSLRRVLV